MWSLNWEKREGIFRYVLVPIYHRIWIWIQEKKDPFWSLLQFLCMYDNLNFTAIFCCFDIFYQRVRKQEHDADGRDGLFVPFVSIYATTLLPPYRPYYGIFASASTMMVNEGEGEGYTCQCAGISRVTCGDDERRSVGWNFALPLSYSSTPWHHSRNIWRTFYGTDSLKHSHQRDNVNFGSPSNGCFFYPATQCQMPIEINWLLFFALLFVGWLGLTHHAVECRVLWPGWERHIRMRSDTLFIILLP